MLWGAGQGGATAQGWLCTPSHPKPQVTGYSASSSRVPGFPCFCFSSLKTMKYDKWLFRAAKHKCSLEQWFLKVNVLERHPGIWA